METNREKLQRKRFKGEEETPVEMFLRAHNKRGVALWREQEEALARQREKLEQERLAAFGGSRLGRRQQGARDAKGGSEREHIWRGKVDDCKKRSAEIERQADQCGQELSDLARRSRETERAREQALDEARRNRLCAKYTNRQIEREVERREEQKRSPRATESEQRERDHREAKERQREEARAAKQARERAKARQEEQLRGEPEFCSRRCRRAKSWKRRRYQQKKTLRLKRTPRHGGGQGARAD